MPTCINGETEAQRSWPAEPGFEPCSLVAAPVLKSGVRGLPGCSLYAEEEFPGEKDMSVPLAALAAHVQVLSSEWHDSPPSAENPEGQGHPSTVHTEYCVCSHFLI